MRFKELVETVPKGQPVYHNYVHTQWCYPNRKTCKQWGSSQTCECPTLPFFSLYNGSSVLEHVKFNKFEIATESYKKLQFLYAKVKTPYLLPHTNKLMNALNKWGRQFSAKDLFALRMASLLLYICRGHFTLQMFPEVEKTCQFNKRKRLETSDIQLFGNVRITPHHCSGKSPEGVSSTRTLWANITYHCQVAGPCSPGERSGIKSAQKGQSQRQRQTET